MLVPGVVDALLACDDFAAIRIKNRLDPGLEAGYRDVQMLVREPKGGFIVEVQVIPKEMYALKQADGYTKYRFVLEACKRAKARQDIHASPPSTAALTDFVARPAPGMLPTVDRADAPSTRAGSLRTLSTDASGAGRSTDQKRQGVTRGHEA